jgi:hypothetical protein
MSIFLLISIGSVCASDAAMDADAQLADAGSNDVVLANDSSADTAKIDTTVVSKDVTINEGEAAELDVNVKDNESNDIKFTKNEIKINEGNKTINFNYTNSSIVLTDKLSAGNHSLIINYLGNANYTNSSAKILLSIVGNYTLITPTSVDINSTKITLVPIKLTDSVKYYDINKDGLTLIATYKDGNNTINKTIDEFEFNNGTLKFNYDLSVNTATLIINYIEGNKTVVGNTTLNRIYKFKIEAMNTECEYSTGSFTFKLIDVDTNEILANKTVTVSVKNGTGSAMQWIIKSGSSYSIGSTTTFTSDENGILTIKNANFYPSFVISEYVFAPVGNYTFSFSDSGNVKGSGSAGIKINKASINIVPKAYKEYYLSEKKVEITVTNAKTGEAMRGVVLHLNMPNTSAKDYYFQTDENGTSQINVSGLVGGTYKYTVCNNDTDNINYKNVSGTVQILKNPAKISTKDYTIYYNSGSTATIKVTDKKTGKALANVYVLLQFDSGKKAKYYVISTNKKGENTFSVPLAVGKHKMTVSLVDNRYDASSVTKTITVKKATAKITAAKTTAYYKQGKYFTVKVTNTKNKKPIYGAKVKIQVVVSSKRAYSYTGTTGADGKVNLKLDYKPGTYNVLVSAGESKNYTASSVISKIIVKKAPAKLVTKKLTAKKGVKKFFKVTVKNKKTKKVIAGVKVKIKVYTGKSYKTYTKKTNSKGIAQLNVKSLKLGTHKVVVNSANKYVTAKTAKSSIKITKK